MATPEVPILDIDDIKPKIPYPAWADHYPEINAITNVQAESSEVINGYSVPKLTADQLVKVYNAIATGGASTITSESGEAHFFVNQSDYADGEIFVEILYYNIMLLSYSLSGENVEISYKNL